MLRRFIPTPERGFTYQRRDGMLLVLPAPVGKMNRSDWSDQEMPWRSVIVREATGEVLSAGFPKFFNYAESGNPNDPLSPEAQRLLRALETDERVWMTLKVDGSLAIRSVIDGEVIFRTRGTIDFGTAHARAMRACANARYPKLLDPSFEPGRSLLFEFVSPNFRIVLPYDEDDLIFIGAVSHEDLRLADMDELQRLATEHDLRLVEIVELPSDPQGLLAAVHALEGKEGVVARCNGGQTLIKLKGAEYLARHRLRFALSARVIRETCIERDVRSSEDFERYLQEAGGDWELCADAKPLVECYLRAAQAARERLAQLRAEVARKREELPDRGDFARDYALALGGAATHAAFALLSGREEQAFKVLRDERLERDFEALERADERLAETD